MNQNLKKEKTEEVKKPKPLPTLGEDKTDVQNRGKEVDRSAGGLYGK